MNITVIFTCYNRKDRTCQCIQSLIEGNPSLNFRFVVVDDASTDGTLEKLEELKQNGIEITIIRGSGELFWSGGMRKGIEYAKQNSDSALYMLINDDVEFIKNSIEKMINQRKCGEVLIGSTCDNNGNLTYGGIRYTGKGVHYLTVGPDETDQECDTFNANCVLIPADIFLVSENIDFVYRHSLGDFDYGLSLKRKGVSLKVADSYVGICNKNSIDGTWIDKSLSRKERLKSKASVKGAPWKIWFYFLKKNFGLCKAIIYSMTPYLRIVIRH